ncbi:hypothetical protein GOODEAATRI_000385 [Goodea atripinnis]|uniref:Uncharacterized protein n=1 Tax=Goodea atripinnis TaxID=208336 RepID=A0ABV0NQP8_9TELE
MPVCVLGRILCLSGSFFVKIGMFCSAVLTCQEWETLSLPPRDTVMRRIFFPEGLELALPLVNEEMKARDKHHCPSAASTPPNHSLCHMSHTAAPASSTVGLSPRGAQTADSGIIAVEYAFRAHLPWDAVPADCDAIGEEGLTGSL